ncbi:MULTISPECIES: hypothetical protein [unclassified Streptomyces]|uniref:hypothetical protein n=1 Tax=unclassified Streptomyces TaxID=2593676 RepID=UPI0033F917B6
MGTLVGALVGALGLSLAGAPVSYGDDSGSTRPVQQGSSQPAMPADNGRGRQSGCDPLGTSACLLPFPNDWFTRPDPRSPTGRRLALDRTALPANSQGTRPDPAPWNRLDGFSPGSTLTVQVPDLDPDATGIAPVTDIGLSLAPDAPIVLVDMDTGKRAPYWVEPDANATRPDRRALLIHPAKNLVEGHRYAVGLRMLRDANGAPLPVPEAFAKVAGPRLPATDPLAARQRELRPALRALARAGVARERSGGLGRLGLAWDFTVASRQSLTGDLLTIRDDALRGLGGSAPPYAITGVKDFTEQQDPYITREVRGEVTVPSYLDTPGGPSGSRFHRGSDGAPRQLPGNTQKAGFRCEIPRSALTKPARPALYGHGLFGGRDEVGGGNVRAMAEEHGFTFCATDWAGMAREDVPTAAAALGDLGRFPELSERLQQGLLNAVFLGRALVHPDGLPADPALRTADGRPLLDTTHGLAYDGNSQGGILGGALIAVSPDIERGVLGVTGMNYGLLLNRSVDFAPFRAVLDRSYPDKLDQQLYLGLAQLLWDHGETNGYAAHLTHDHLPGTPHHQVLMHIAYGDHQVANVAADVEARALGARLVTPALAAGRSPDRTPYWGIRPIRRLPYRGSAMSVWDSGAPSPPTTNTPPTGHGHDPHSDPRNSAAARAQKGAFLTTGRVIDVCGGAPCTATPVPLRNP